MSEILKKIEKEVREEARNHVSSYLEQIYKAINKNYNASKIIYAYNEKGEKIYLNGNFHDQALIKGNSDEYIVGIPEVQTKLEESFLNAILRSSSIESRILKQEDDKKETDEFELRVEKEVEKKLKTIKEKKDYEIINQYLDKKLEDAVYSISRDVAPDAWIRRCEKVIASIPYLKINIPALKKNKKSFSTKNVTKNTLDKN